MTITPSAPDPYGFADPITPENVEASFAKLSSMQDDPSQPIEIPEHEPEPVDEPPVEPIEPTPSTEPTPTPTPPVLESVTIDGQQYPVALLREFIQFDQFLKLNPAAADRMKLAFDPTFNPTTQTSPQQQTQPYIQQQQDLSITPPDELDLEDPTVRYMVQNLEAVRQQNAQLQAYVDAQRQLSDTQLLQQGVDTFTSKHPELTPDEVIQIRQQTAQQNLLDGFMRAGHPINIATEMALDYMMWNIPPIRSKLVEAQQLDLAHQEAVTETQKAAEAARQRRLNAISGSNGNSSRVAPPATESPRLGLLRGIREALTDQQQAQ